MTHTVNTLHFSEYFKEQQCLRKSLELLGIFRVINYKDIQDWILFTQAKHSKAQDFEAVLKING